MKKQIIYILQFNIIIIFIIASSLTLSAQLVIHSDSPEPKHNIKFGYGFITTWSNQNDYNDYPERINTKLTGPIYLKYDYFADYDFTVGITLSYSYDHANILVPDNVQQGNIASYTRSSFGVLFRMNYIMLPHKRVQPYLGFGLGVNSVDEKGYKYIYDNSHYSYNIFINNNTNHLSPFNDHSNPISGELTFGTNFIIKKGFGAYIEIGAAQSIIQLGFIKSFGKNIP